jgi:hypothetical protein
MPVLGLKSGKEIRLSKKQYEALMTRREPFIGGLMMEIYDQDKVPLGKIKSDCIEYISPDNSLLLTDSWPGPEPTYECPVPGCGKVFSHSSSLSRHKAKDHA